MDHQNEDVWLEVWEIFKPLYYATLVIALSLFIVSFPVIVEPLCRFAENAKAESAISCTEFWLYRYQTFIAGVFALAAAFIGGYYVNKSASMSHERDLERLEKIQFDAREVATVALNPCVQAAAVSLSLVRAILQSAGEPELHRPMLLRLQELKVALSKGLEHFSIREISRDMEINQRLLFLIVVRTLDTYVTIYKIDTTPVSAKELGNMLHTLELVGHYVSLFDVDLSNMFQRDSRLSADQ